MIIDIELFLKTSSHSRTKILCRCDTCGVSKLVSKYNIREIYTICRSCNANKVRKHYNKDDNFFHIPNLLNSYWAGFIAADGCVEEAKKNNAERISFGLIHTDAKHLEQFVKDASYDGSVKVYENRRKAILHITSHQWAEDLRQNYSISSRKSLTFIPPELSLENSQAFLVGLIDGDGCIRKDKWDRVVLSIIGTTETAEWCMSVFKQTRFDGCGRK